MGQKTAKTPTSEKEGWDFSASELPLLWLSILFSRFSGGLAFGFALIRGFLRRPLR